VNESGPRRNVVVLGSTGSIGRQTIDVIRSHPERLAVVGLAAGRAAETLAEQARALGVARTGLGAEAAIELAALPEADVVVNAIVGAAGLRASLAALEAGKSLALANKESLVAGGELCAAARLRGGGRLLPVDSEHAALAACLEGRDLATVARLVLTASGGPFRERTRLEGITPDEALAHPTWSMGPKITVDSATLMNKGLEVIEAHHLFGLPYERIGVLIHPQSVVHGIVELTDGSSLLQAAPADMRIPIQRALTSPDERVPVAAPVDLAASGPLEFEPVDEERWPAVALATEAGRRGATYPAALNAANETAVHAFLEERLDFVEIVGLTEAVLARHEPLDARNLDAVLEVDAWARRTAQSLVSGGRAADKRAAG
jgi:1-deoxy-D-xylulose-5-phosphate reductoisomerase